MGGVAGGGMTKCKLRVRRLTLAPGRIKEVHAEEEDVDIDEEATRILAREHLHHVVEILIASSLAEKIRPPCSWGRQHVVRSFLGYRE
jgi:hypothetical protein